jgi:4-amino-4-deoxy-L-arabinose transferase-like glycosyltransferase
MLGPAAYCIWIFCTLLEASVVVCALARGCFRRYFTLNLYMAASVAMSIGRYIILSRYGFDSEQYFYFYYYSDAILTICLYFALMGLYSIVFAELGATTQVRAFSMLLLGGTALFSYGVVHQAENRLVTRYVVEISQNLYFVGLVLTYVLWGAVLKLRETRARVVQFVLSLGVYFSLYAGSYALRNVYPNSAPVLMYVSQITGTLLPLAWNYAYLRFDDEARLAPSRLAVIPR